MRKTALALAAAAWLIPSAPASGRARPTLLGTATVQPTGSGRAPLRRHRLPPPVLMVRRGKRSVPLQLTRVDVRATVVGHLAETTMTMVFFNPNRRRHEGDLYFPLPEGSTVSGYALDVGGRMVEGVVVDKDRARQVFESEVRRGIDPGLVEWTRGRNFKTRVFPIPARGTRTIRVSYVAEVDQSGREAVYRLPLAFRRKVRSFSLRVEVVRAAAMPVVRGGGPGGLRFGRWRDSYVASAKLRDVQLDRDLRVALPGLDRVPVRVEKGPDGKYYFTIRHLPTARRSSSTSHPRRIALYWDASMSRARVSHARELALLGRYLDSLRRPVTVSLVVFRNVAERPRRFRLPAQRKALWRALRRVRYDGGTQMGALRPVPGRQDLALVFSDGLSSLGRERPPSLGAPVYTVNVATSANHAFLRYLALRSGGAYLNLNRVGLKAALATIGSETFSFISATATGADSTSLYPKVRTPVQGAFTLAGRMTGAVATVTLRFGVGSRVTYRRTFTISRKTARSGNLVRRAWAQKKLDDLLIFPERNRDAIATLGKGFALVTPVTSLLVLESLSQYIRHKVRPPSSLPAMARRWDVAMRRLALQKRKRAASKLAWILALWKRRLAWYAKRFPRSYHVPRFGTKGASRLLRTRRAGGAATSPGSSGAPLGGHQRVARSGRRMSGRRGIGGGGGRSVVRSLEKHKKTGAGASPGASISLRAWDPKTPYLKALKAAPRRGRYAVYLKQRKKHGAAPAFYLDCANHFRKMGQRRLALRILTNLAEMELESPALLRVLAHRLAQVGELDLSIAVFDKVRALRPEDPQSYRDLALVLERRGDARRRRRGRAARSGARADYERAMRLLARVVMERWARFSEIEVIALTELNHIWPKARRLGARRPPVDRRLIKRLTMDVRIVMTWDADLTDMDLHVVEPSGEEAYYSHNRTAIGGMVSRDFTRGYGPEVYLIRRAMRGKYKIKTKYYGSSAAKIAGAVTLQVDVYTNYGRSNERRRSITIRLTKSKEVFSVGTIRF